MFNGKDLSDWVHVNGHPGTFFVRDEMIVTTGQPTGFLRTANQYENFVLNAVSVTVNGKAVLSAELKTVSPSGTLGLVDNGAPLEFRSVFVRELK